MKAWFAGFDPRERRLLIAGAALLALMVLYLLVWEPLQQGVAAQHRSHQEQQALLHWMQGAVAEVKQLRGQGSLAHIPKGQSLLAVIDRTARANQLGGALKRVQPDGESRARVWLEGGGFDAVIRWVAGLEGSQGVRVVSSVFETTEVAGRVDARLVFESGGGA